MTESKQNKTLGESNGKDKGSERTYIRSRRRRLLRPERKGLTSGPRERRARVKSRSGERTRREEIEEQVEKDEGWEGGREKRRKTVPGTGIADSQERMDLASGDVLLTVMSLSSPKVPRRRCINLLLPTPPY